MGPSRSLMGLPSPSRLGAHVAMGVGGGQASPELPELADLQRDAGADAGVEEDELVGLPPLRRRFPRPHVPPLAAAPHCCSSWACHRRGAACHGLACHQSPQPRATTPFSAAPIGYQPLKENKEREDEGEKTEEDRRGKKSTGERRARERLRLYLVAKSFSPNFTIHLLHQIFCLMHGVLNVNK